MDKYTRVAIWKKKIRSISIHRWLHRSGPAAGGIFLLWLHLWTVLPLTLEEALTSAIFIYSLWFMLQISTEVQMSILFSQAAFDLFMHLSFSQHVLNGKDFCLICLEKRNSSYIIALIERPVGISLIKGNIQHYKKNTGKDSLIIRLSKGNVPQLFTWIATLNEPLQHFQAFQRILWL